MYRTLLPSLYTHARQRINIPLYLFANSQFGKVCCRGTPAPAGHSLVHVHGQGTSGRRSRLLARLACDTESNRHRTPHTRLESVGHTLEVQHLRVRIPLRQNKCHLPKCSRRNAHAASPRTCCARSSRHSSVARRGKSLLMNDHQNRCGAGLPRHEGWQQEPSTTRRALFSRSLLFPIFRRPDRRGPNSRNRRHADLKRD